MSDRWEYRVRYRREGRAQAAPIIRQTLDTALKHARRLRAFDRIIPDLDFHDEEPGLLAELHVERRRVGEWEPLDWEPSTEPTEYEVSAMRVAHKPPPDDGPF
jgi:hypothetical protein